MRLTKAQRESVRQKYDGRCAYCGCALPDRWHVDHLEPVLRATESRQISPGKYVLVSGTETAPENHRMENLMPACPACNINKAMLPLESWREWLERTTEGLSERSSLYKMAIRFGLVIETGKRVIFYFENKEQGND